MRKITASILWRRLDVPGHDACGLLASPQGWELEGAAVFLHEGLPARVGYHVVCDQAWRTLRGAVLGWIGTRSIQLLVTRGEGDVWSLNGQAIAGLEHCLDLDLGFTPATNLLQLRRVALEEGQSAAVPVAWLDVTSSALELLPQIYERRSRTSYWYESPSSGYSALLEINAEGFVARYPGLWQAESLQSGETLVTLLDGVTDAKRHGEIQTGDAQGNEVW